MQAEEAVSVLSSSPLTEIRATSCRPLLPWKPVEEGDGHTMSQVMPEQGRQVSLHGVGPPHGAQATQCAGCRRGAGAGLGHE